MYIKKQHYTCNPFLCAMDFAILWTLGGIAPLPLNTLNLWRANLVIYIVFLISDLIMSSAVILSVLMVKCRSYNLKLK